MTKLEKMLKYVSEHNEFYKNRIKEYGIKDPLDITQWPVLTRKELQENRYNMFSDGYIEEYYKGNMIRKTSSGSSGIPVNVYWPRNELYASNLSLWRRRMKWYGIKPSDRYVVFSLNAYNHTLKSQSACLYTIKDSILLINITSVRDEEDYQKIAHIINEFNPVWLYVQPSILSELIYIYQKYFIPRPPNLRYIESIGELLTAETKRSASWFFGVEVANMYGSEEMNGIAYECPHHSMNILDDNVYLEIENNTGIHPYGTGETIITSLHSYGMPLIRYKQGDMISIDDAKNCLCSDLGKQISIIYGRVHNSIQINDKTILNSFFLMELISEVNNQFNDIILQYRFVYEEKNRKLTCYVVFDHTRTNWKQSTIGVIAELFYSKVAGTIIKFEVKEEIRRIAHEKKTILEKI